MEREIAIHASYYLVHKCTTEANLICRDTKLPKNTCGQREWVCGETTRTAHVARWPSAGQPAGDDTTVEPRPSSTGNIFVLFCSLCDNARHFSSKARCFRSAGHYINLAG